MKVDRIIKIAENRGFRVGRISSDKVIAYKLMRTYQYKSYNEMYNKLIKNERL